MWIDAIRADIGEEGILFVRVSETLMKAGLGAVFDSPLVEATVTHSPYHAQSPMELAPVTAATTALWCRVCGFRLLMPTPMPDVYRFWHFLTRRYGLSYVSVYGSADAHREFAEYQTKHFPTQSQKLIQAAREQDVDRLDRMRADDDGMPMTDS